MPLPSTTVFEAEGLGEICCSALADCVGGSTFAGELGTLLWLSVEEDPSDERARF